MSILANAEETRWSLARLLSWTSEYFQRQRLDDARLAAEVLLAHVAGCRRIDLYTRFDDVLDDARVKHYRELVRRAAQGEPVAYLVGEKEFFSLAFRVTPDVLIPRGETETLVECAVDHCRRASLTKPLLLDLGTGSGCVIVATLCELKNATAFATDVSPKALAIAEQNARRHAVASRITFVEADGLALPKGIVPECGFDVLMSNPPYVAAEAMAGLDAAVRDYEPTIALSDGVDGLSFYRQIAREGPELLTPSGIVLVEIGDGQESAVVDIMSKEGELVHRGSWKDRVTRRERVLVFSRASSELEETGLCNTSK